MTKEKQENKKPFKKNKRRLNLCKAPQAPKRFRSSFILFYSHVKVKIKAQLGDKATGPDISKKASNMWKCLSPEDRQYWNDKAMKERVKYAAEKEAYTGPWRVLHKRVKKDPTAPRRNPSAFLLFAQDERKELKKLNPTMKITEISRILGKLWRDMPMEKKRPYIEKEVEERDKYMKDVAEWRRQQEKKRMTGENSSSFSRHVSSDKSDVLEKERARISEGAIVTTGNDGIKGDDIDSYPPQFVSFNENNHDSYSNPFHMLDYSGNPRHQYMYPQSSIQEQYITGYEQKRRSGQYPQLNFGYLQPSNQPLYLKSCASLEMEWQENSADSQNRNINYSQYDQRMTYHVNHDHLYHMQPLDLEPNIGREILDALSQHNKMTEEQTLDNRNKERSISHMHYVQDNTKKDNIIVDQYKHHHQVKDQYQLHNIEQQSRNGRQTDSILDMNVDVTYDPIPIC